MLRKPDINATSLNADLVCSKRIQLPSNRPGVMKDRCIKDEITWLLSSEHTVCFATGSARALQRWHARKSKCLPFYYSQRKQNCRGVWIFKEITLQPPHYLKQVFLLAQMLFHFLVQLFQSFLKFFRRVLFDALSQFLFAECQLISNFILLDSSSDALLDSLKKDLQHQEYRH